MFAEVPTSLEIGGWVLCLFGLAGGVNQVLKIFDRTKESPPPRDTYQVKGDYALKAELVSIREDLDNLESTLRGLIEKVRDEMKHDHETNTAGATARWERFEMRVSDIMGAVSELRGRVDRKR